MRTTFDTKQKIEEVRKAKEEQMRETMESAKVERENLEEEAY